MRELKKNFGNHNCNKTVLLIYFSILWKTKINMIFLQTLNILNLSWRNNISISFHQLGINGSLSPKRESPTSSKASFSLNRLVVRFWQANRRHRFVPFDRPRQEKKTNVVVGRVACICVDTDEIFVNNFLINRNSLLKKMLSVLCFGWAEAVYRVSIVVENTWRVGANHHFVIRCRRFAFF